MHAVIRMVFPLLPYMLANNTSSVLRAIKKTAKCQKCSLVRLQKAAQNVIQSMYNYCKVCCLESKRGNNFRVLFIALAQTERYPISKFAYV